MFDEFARNIMAANGGDTADPYARFFAVNYNASPAQFAGKKAAVQADIDETQRRESFAAGQDEIKKKIAQNEERLDPGKAKMVMRPDRSGYDFFDGGGNKLNINQYSLLTGTNPADLLKDSDNPRDQQFVNDYATMKTLSNAWVNGDTQTLAKYREADPEKYNQLVSTYKNPGEMVKGFMSYYSDYYGNTNDQKDTKGGWFSPKPPAQGAQNFGADRSVALVNPNNPKQTLGSPTFQQTITPVTRKAPTPDNILDQILPEWLGGGFARRKREYEDYLSENPWARYNALIGR